MLSLRSAVARVSPRTALVSPVLSRAALAPLAARRTIFEGWGVPQPPGNIVGTVNDAVPTPAFSPSHGSHHWSFERLIAIAIVPLTIYPATVGGFTPVVDALFGALLVAHTHIGFACCVTDYFPKRKFPRGNTVLMTLLGMGSAGALWGVYKLETEDEGLCGSIAKVWTA